MSRSTSQGRATSPSASDERDLQLVEGFVARFVNPRALAGGADEEPGEQIGQTGVVLPVGHQAPEQIGPPQERAVGRGSAAERDVVAALGAGVAAVEHELLGPEPRQVGLLVQGRRHGDQTRPVGRRVDVDLDDARDRG